MIRVFTLCFFMVEKKNKQNKQTINIFDSPKTQAIKANKNIGKELLCVNTEQNANMYKTHTHTKKRREKKITK